MSFTWLLGIASCWFFSYSLGISFAGSFTYFLFILFLLLISPSLVIVNATYMFMTQPGCLPSTSDLYVQLPTSHVHLNGSRHLKLNMSKYKILLPPLTSSIHCVPYLGISIATTWFKPPISLAWIISNSLQSGLTDPSLLNFGLVLSKELEWPC